MALPILIPPPTTGPCPAENQMGHSCQMFRYDTENTPPVSPLQGSDSDEGLVVTPTTKNAAITLASFKVTSPIPAPAAAAVAVRIFFKKVQEENDTQSRKRRSSSAPL